MAKKLKPPPPGVIQIDLRPIIFAFTDMAKHAMSALSALQDWLGFVTPERAAQRRRRALGLGNGAPAVWQSDLCAAFLHDDCGARGLCTCRCHR